MSKSYDKRLSRLESDAPPETDSVVTLDELAKIAPEPVYRYLIAMNAPAERALATTGDKYAARDMIFREHPAVEDVIDALYREYYLNGGTIRLDYVRGWLLKWTHFRFMWAVAREQRTVGPTILTDDVQAIAAHRMFGCELEAFDACWFNPPGYVSLWQSGGTNDPDVLTMAKLGIPEVELLNSV